MHPDATSTKLSMNLEGELKRKEIINLTLVPSSVVK